MAWMSSSIDMLVVVFRAVLFGNDRLIGCCRAFFFPTLCKEAQVPTPEMAVTPPSIRKSAPTTYAESSDAR